MNFTMTNNNRYYVVYMLLFRNGQYYIGKTKNFNRRMRQHQHGNYNGKINLKEEAVLLNVGFTSKVLFEVPPSVPKHLKQHCMDNMERIIIHREAKKVYDEMTGENSNFQDYQPYRHIINKKLVNTQLY